jgi:hypothetical protein
MDKEKIKKLAGSKQFITGIYNYCDQWCERCPFTSRCLNFALGEEQFADPQSRDIANEVFWQKLAETFQGSLDLLGETAEREGIDLDALDTDELAEEQRANEEVAENHECCRAARTYGEMVDDWFDSATDLFGQKEEETNLNVLHDIPNVSPFGEGAGFEEAVQVVRWYQQLIYAKLMRAMRGQLEEKPEIHDEFASDWDGSAKVALIAIDRSIAAWGEIRSHYPLDDSDILDLMVYLDRLRRRVEKVFPGARGFIRPGFDKVRLHS